MIADAETELDREAASVDCALCELEEVAELTIEGDRLDELVRVACVALDETDGVCDEENAGDFESSRSDGLTVGDMAGDADDESVL